MFTPFQSPEAAVLTAMALCLGGALVTLAVDHRRRLAGWVSFGIVALSAALVLAAVVHVLRDGPGHGVTFFALPELGFALRLYVDGLSAAFLALIAVVTVCASFHRIDYMSPNSGRPAVVPPVTPKPKTAPAWLPEKN